MILEEANDTVSMLVIQRKQTTMFVNKTYFQYLSKGSVGELEHSLLSCFEANAGIHMSGLRFVEFGRSTSYRSVFGSFEL